jgi:electron transport complex protein RnfC
MGLIPTYLASYAYNEKWDALQRLNINDCFECGCCTYACPTRNPLVQLIKTGKAESARRKTRMERRAAELAVANGEEEGGDGE